MWDKKQFYSKLCVNGQNALDDEEMLFDAF